ncbi:MAG TPA: C1 family peptidase [Flavisolibacter sp.]
MKRILLLLPSTFIAGLLFAQMAQEAVTLSRPEFLDIKTVKATSVKNQAMTGTCWCFSTTSLVESDEIRKDKQEIDLSEMYTVRNIYIEKAKNYVLRQGHAQFGEGGLGHDMIRSTATYGAIPLSAYTGLVNGQTQYNHQELFGKLQSYLDSVLKKQPISSNWMDGYTKLLDQYLGTPPAEFTYNGKNYNPKSFAKEVLHFNADDYVSLTSFTDHPFYSSFILPVPDNFANGSFYNVPLNELTDVVKEAVNKGYSVSWDADVSNIGFRQMQGLALNLDPSVKYTREMISTSTKEMPYDATIRQRLFENLTTQDDHLMHIVGTEKSKEGKTFFVVKNSWGKVGPFDGYINVSEAYFGINTISVVVPKAALPKDLLAKLH